MSLSSLYSENGLVLIADYMYQSIFELSPKREIRFLSKLYFVCFLNFKDWRRSWKMEEMNAKKWSDLGKETRHIALNPWGTFSQKLARHHSFISLNNKTDYHGTKNYNSVYQNLHVSHPKAINELAIYNISMFLWLISFNRFPLWAGQFALKTNTLTYSALLHRYGPGWNENQIH